MSLFSFGIHKITREDEKHLKVGFIFVGDEITPYTNNFIKARDHVKEVYGDRIECVTIYNVAEGQVKSHLQELVDEGCDYIIAASYGYGPDVKAIAELLKIIRVINTTTDQRFGWSNVRHTLIVSYMIDRDLQFCILASGSWTNGIRML